MTTDLIAKDTSVTALFRSRDEVREVKARITAMLPGGERLNDAQRTALAQGAIAHGLDPFNGEIWMIPGSGLMIGIKGLRKKAHEQVKGNFWIDFRQIVNAEERAQLGIKQPDALAFEARLFDSENIRTYSETVTALMKAGIPWESVKGMVGERPYTTGIGVFSMSERTKMQPAQCAMKRAEADAIKRRFDVPFGLTIAAGTDTDVEESGLRWDNVIDGEATTHDATDDETAQRLENGKRALGRDDGDLVAAQDEQSAAASEQVNWTTMFWSEAKSRGIDKAAALKILSDAGADFETAYQRMTAAA